jgi:hypothetical protein
MITKFVFYMFFFVLLHVTLCHHTLMLKLELGAHKFFQMHILLFQWHLWGGGYYWTICERCNTSFGQSKQDNMWNCSQSNDNSIFFYERVLEGKVQWPLYYLPKIIDIPCNELLSYYT